MRGNKKVALVTGGNRGIGFATCRILALNNFNVVLTARSVDKGQKAVRQLLDEELEVVFHQLDVSDPGSISKAVDFVESEFGKLDVLVNNAGVSLDEGRRFIELPPDLLEKTVDVNLLGAFRVIQGFLSLMKKNGYGRIVNISSGLGASSSLTSGTGAYKLSKYALNGMTRILADELDSGKIKINSLNPGWVRTDMGGKSAPRSPEDAARNILWLSTLDEDGPTGKFIKDRKVIEF